MTRPAAGGQPRSSPRPTVTRRHTLAIASLVGIALVLASPLMAAPALAGNLVIVIDSPSEGRVFGSGTTASVSGEVGTGLLTSVESITVELFHGDTPMDSEVLCQPCGSEPSVPFSYTTPILDRNGPYRVRATATGYLLANGIRVADASDERSFAMAVPPAPPTNVNARHGDGKVTVTWSPGGSYPDLVGYVVYRKTGSAGFAPVSAGLPASTTSFVDSQPPAAGGNVQYQVVAIRGGAAPGSENWLTAASEGVVVMIPAAPTSVPAGQGGGPTTTLPPGGGLQPDGAVNNVGNLGNLGNLFPSAAGLQFPTPSSGAAGPPDGGYSDTLPFGAKAASGNNLGGGSGNKVDGRQPGRPASSSGRGELESGDLSDSNRRALLVPVATGSILCVSALHLRWLNRRLAVPSPGGGPGAGGAPDLDPADLGPAGLDPTDLGVQRIARKGDLMRVG